MPVVAVKLPEKLFRQIARLVADGAFETPGQFLETAAFNQLALEAGAPPETLGRDAPHAVARAGAHAREETPAANRTKSVPRAPERAGSVVLRTSVRERVPNEYARADDRKESFGDLDGALHRLSLAQLIDKALPEAAPAKPRPGDERLWVQFNRVFGLKVACRWIACASAGAQTWPEVSVCTDAMASDVAELGSALERADAMAGRKRDELLATGLPRRRNMASLDRFVSQTIARITRAGTVYPGAVLQYSLAVLDGRRIALTDRGSFFAQMPNPILDADLFAATTTLSRDEQKFLLAQVAEYVPGELTDFRAVLSAISDGESSPDEVVDVVRRGLRHDWSDEVARTHVAGVVGRMAELDLIRREWNGRRVRYELSDVKDLPEFSRFLGPELHDA